MIRLESPPAAVPHASPVIAAASRTTDDVLAARKVLVKRLVCVEDLGNV